MNGKSKRLPPGVPAVFVNNPTPKVPSPLVRRPAGPRRVNRGGRSFFRGL